MDPADDTRPSRLVLALAVMAVAIGVVLRFVTLSHLWLDEALSVNISRLPLAHLRAALRQDGAPPLYYVLLHLWMSVFGTGDVAVRALSGLISVATLPLGWLVGRRVGGRRAAAAALVLLATSPFAIRYATETRMYSLLVLLVLAGFLLLDRLLASPSVGRALAVAVVTGLLILTHYWAFYLVALTGVGLALRWRRQRDRGSVLALLAVAGGGVLFIPWLPTFLFQMKHTGTPWAPRPHPAVIISTLQDWSASYTDAGLALFLVLFALVLLGLMGRPSGDRLVELDLRTRPGVRRLVATCFGILFLAWLVGATLGSAFVVRYTSVAFPLFLVSAAFGTLVLSDAGVRHGVLAVAMALGLLAATSNLGDTRTQAGQVASALRARAAAGDTIVYCPDQLGPAASRLLPSRYHQLTYPTGDPPQRIDWVDYAQRNKASRSAPFARRLVDQAAGHAIWVVWAPSYRTYGTRCQALIIHLTELRPRMRRVVPLSNSFDERMGLIEFRAR